MHKRTTYKTTANNIKSRAQDITLLFHLETYTVKYFSCFSCITKEKLRKSEICLPTFWEISKQFTGNVCIKHKLNTKNEKLIYMNEPYYYIFVNRRNGGKTHLPNY